MNHTASAEPVPTPRGWVRLALFGSFVYLASQLMAFFPAAAARATQVDPATLAAWLPVGPATGLVLFLGGTVAAFWRVNRVAGHTAAGVMGLVGGTLGVLLLAGLDLLALVVAFGAHNVVLDSHGSDVPLVQLLGTFLAFAGLATLGLGLAHALWVAEPARPEPTASAQSGYGSAGYRSY